MSKEAPLHVPMRETATVTISIEAPSDGAGADDELLLNVVPMVPCHTGGRAVAVQLADVLVACGSTRRRIHDRGARSLAETALRAKQLPPPRLVYIKIEGLATGGLAPAFVFLDGVAALLMARLPLQHASCVLTRLHTAIECIDVVEENESEEDDPQSVRRSLSCTIQRVVGWCTSLTSWRNFMRHFLATMSAEQRTFCQSWLLGFKSEVSIPAGELARLSREGRAEQARGAKARLRQRAAEAWQLLTQRVALSGVALAHVRAEADIEARVAREYERVEQEQLADVAASQQEQAQDEERDEDEEEMEDADRAEEFMPKLNKTIRRQVAAAAQQASKAMRNKLRQKSQVLRERDLAWQVEITTERHGVFDEGAPSPWDNQGAIDALFANKDGDTMALLVAMFGTRKDDLMVTPPATRTHLCSRDPISP